MPELNKPEAGYVRFWIENGTEFAMMTAADFRKGMLDRDHEIQRLEQANSMLAEECVAWKAKALRNEGVHRANVVLQPENERLRLVVEAARFADNCIDDDDPVSTHNNGPGSCLWDLHKALVALDRPKDG